VQNYAIKKRTFSTIKNLPDCKHSAGFFVGGEFIKNSAKETVKNNFPIISL